MSRGAGRRGLCWLLMFYCLAGKASADAARDRLSGFLQEVKTVEAQFVQSLSDADGDVLENAGGRFWLRRPGQFRWDYTQPYQREVVSDGDRVWIFDPELEQVTVREIGDSLGRTPAGLLAGSESALDGLEISGLDRPGDLDWIQVVSTDGATEFSAVVLGFAGDQLVELEFVDRLDQTTRISFDSLKLNGPIPDERFSFEPPAGVDVIGNLVGAGAP